MSYEDNGAPYGSIIDRTHSNNFFVAPVVKWSLDEDTWTKLEINYSNETYSYYTFYAPMINGSFVRTPRNNSYLGDAPVLFTTFYSALTGSHNFNEDWSIKSRVAFYSTNTEGNNNPPISTSTGSNPVVTLTKAGGPSLLSSWQTGHDVVGHFNLLGSKSTLLLGGDYNRFTYASITQNSYPWSYSIVSATYPIFPGIPILPTGTTSHNETYNRQDSAGLYIQDQVELPYGFHVMAGARYQYIFQWSTSGSKSASFVEGPVSNTNIPAHIARVTPRFGLLWRPREWVSLYGNYTEGFAANNGTIFPGQLAPPSNAESWEAGAKFELFDGRLRANVDYFYLLKTNIPIADPDPTHLCNGTASCSVVVGAARSSGTEVDVQGELLPGWNVIVSYTNQDVRVAEGQATGTSGPGLANLKPGQRFPHTPRNLARLWTSYEFQDPLLKGLKVGAGYSYHGSQPIQDGSGGKLGAIPLLSSYGTVDLMAAYTFDLDGLKTTAQVNAKNIFDRTYYTDAIASRAPTPNIDVLGGRLTYGTPFNITGSLKVEF
jgi:iron complex outermembrane recepter protein